MDTKIKIMIDSNPDYKRYLRTNSYWYKTLNRNPLMIDNFIREVKEKYKLRTTDKINDIMLLIVTLFNFTGMSAKLERR